jgi:uncharacterized membrane protein
LITVFMVTTSPDDDSPESPGRGSLWLAALPFLILLMGAIFLALKWDTIPDRWPIHWGIKGQADGWANKTLLGVFFPLAAGALICVFLEGLALIVRATANAGTRLSPEAAATIARLTADFVRLIEIAISIVFVYVGVALPLSPPARAFRLGWLVLAVIIGAIVIGMVRLRKGVQALKQAGHPGLEGYNGIIYKNPDDPRLWVPKISGLGYTLNFAHPWAWPILIAIVAIPLVVVFALVVRS